MEKLLDGFNECGEAAAFYKGKKILLANELFAELLERKVEDCAGLPIMDICHYESIEMIQDFIRRRARDDHSLPASYDAVFKTPSEPRVVVTLTVIKPKNTGDASLVILRRKE
jgi:hypothetical protein